MQRCKLDECCGACCLYGVWVDEKECQDILAHQALLAPYMQPGRRRPGVWFRKKWEDDPFSRSGRVIHSTVWKTERHYGGSECVFFRRDYKCALQVAAVEAGLHPWQLKPFYCILHPLDLDEGGRITLDTTEAMLSEPGSCLRPALKPVALLKTFEEELRYFLGDEKYESYLNHPQKINPT